MQCHPHFISVTLNLHEKLIMDLVINNESTKRRLSFFLAQEEYLARKYPDRELFFAWQVKPTVIIGRNQLHEKEVNVSFCRENGVDIVRRKSGGGAVVADMNNIMFSYINSSDNVCATFSSYTDMVAKALCALGLDATDNTRNDILIGDRKVSGNSYYHIPGRSIVHGTMLYDYDPVLMSNALRPPTTKLASHGVTSTRSRVTTIKEHLPALALADFMAHMLRYVPQGRNPLVLTEIDIKGIEEIEQEYHSQSWLYGKNPKGSIHASDRIDGVGELTVDICLSKGIVSSIELSGDYLENSDAQRAISDVMTGVCYDRKHIESSLDSIDISALIPGLNNEKFINLIF